MRLLASVPPRHGKTDSILLFLVRYLLRHPERTVAYVTYGNDQARDKSRRARTFALRAGLDIGQTTKDASRALHKWTTPQMGGAIFTSIASGLTGQGVHVLVIDDPHKGRAEAESSLERERVWQWYTGVALDRLEPGASVIVVHTRWHPDDLTGRIIAYDGESWRRVNLKAIEDDPSSPRFGEALWPSRWPAEAFAAQRDKNAYEWYSKYQGEPRPRGGAVFRDVRFYDELPKKYRVGIGVDLAYTKKTHADWSVAVTVAEADGVYYVLDVKRAQVAPPEFAATLRALAASYPGARMLWYTSTTERGLADLLREESGVRRLVGEIAGADKFVRAQPVAAAWNAGRVLVPRTGNAVARIPGDNMPSPAWVSELVSEVANFTGVEDRHDDQVDALAAAFDVLDRGASTQLPRTYPSQFGVGNAGGPSPNGTSKFHW